jgi:Spy/CpxP family protein refolding chaperone
MRTLRVFWLAMFLVLAGACSHNEHRHSSYQGQESRAIKSLSEADIAAYTKGEGMGLAKIAELNGFPGPKHILENESAMNLSAEQKAEVQKSFDKMKEKAVELGKQIVEGEKELNELFQQNKIDEMTLLEKTQTIAKLQGGLRGVHLQAHLEMKRILSPQQLENYNRLRGYNN